MAIKIQTPRDATDLSTQIVHQDPALCENLAAGAKTITYNGSDKV